MTGIFVLAVLIIILYISYSHKANKFREIERYRAMRQAILKLNEENKRFSH